MLMAQVTRIGLVQRSALPAAMRIGSTASTRGARPLMVRSYQAATTTVHSPPRQRPIYTNFSLYKGKAAASFRVRKPLWSEAPDGSFSLEKPGAIVLEIAPVAAGSGTAVGARSYQWDKKQTFQLSHLELAGIIETCVTGRPMKDLFHDPNKGREDDGRIAKTLSLQPFSAEGQQQGFFLALSVQDSASREGSVKLGIPVSGPELYTLKTLAEFCIPRFLGWDEVLAEPDVLPAGQGASLG